jgi:ribosomal protein L37AE/L43A
MDDALAEQMATILRERGQLATCDRCGTPMVRRKRFRTDQPHYCEPCRALVRRETFRVSAAKLRARRRIADASPSP